MTPELWVNDEMVASVPDQSGRHDSAIGEVIIEASGVDPKSGRNVIGVNAPGMRRSYVLDSHDGTRWIPLSRKGTGSEDLGSGKTLTVKLERNIVSVNHRNGINSREGTPHGRRIIGEYAPDDPSKTWGSERDINRNHVNEQLLEAGVVINSAVMLKERHGRLTDDDISRVSRVLADISSEALNLLVPKKNGESQANSEAPEGPPSAV